MKFALVNNIKTEASKGAIGICQCCGATLIAKCGTIKINHWSHKGKRECDMWWESETEWHRLWKNEFPIDWQEVTMQNDETNEKHIADVKTKYGLVIEFQHSFINSEEQYSREAFYRNIVWVIDGSRLRYDYPRFVKEKENFKSTNKPQIFAVESVEEYFPKNWLNNSAPVVIDFRNAQEFPYPIDIRNNLYCLFPGQLGKFRIIAEISRTAFINKIMDGEWSKRVNDFIHNIRISDQNIGKRQEQQEMIIKQLSQQLPRNIRSRGYSKRRL